MHECKFVCQSLFVCTKYRRCTAGVEYPWTNAEKTVMELGGRLNPEFIDSLAEEDLQLMIRYCGFYKAESRYVKKLTVWFKGYDFDANKAMQKPMPKVREKLLSLCVVVPRQLTIH